MTIRVELKNRYNALSDEIIHKRKVLAVIPVENKRERMMMVQQISLLQDELATIEREFSKGQPLAII